MTEAEWMACTDPVAMLKASRSRLRHRKVRLFAVACCRCVLPLLTDQRSRNAVEVAERYADGVASDEELKAAAQAASAVHREAFKIKGKEGACREWAAALVADRVAFRAAESVSWMSGTTKVGRADLVRDIIGNPFRPIALDHAWLTPTVLTLAQAAYDERSLPTGTLDPARLAVLADALEDAGYADPELLGHLRGPGLHVRGCWALDLLLGRE